MNRAATVIKGPKGSSWDLFIGLEVHAQVQLRSKLFSRAEACAPREHDCPNSRVSLFDAAFPGTLPALNASAVDQAVKTALVLGCRVHKRSVFERKHYFYSDLPHGYQITQNRHPIATGGLLPLVYGPGLSRNEAKKSIAVKATRPDIPLTSKTTGKSTKPLTPEEQEASGVSEWRRTTRKYRKWVKDPTLDRPPDEDQDQDDNQPAELLCVGINRIQLEVDSGKSLHDRSHPQGPPQSLVDLNRAGAALMEIVFEPEVRSAEEASALVRSLQLLLRRVGTCDGNMEDGSMRWDLNISLRPHGKEDLMGERVEVKNMNSVRHTVTAVKKESQRQARLLEQGEGPIERETRTFDALKGDTVRLRGKEGAVDYRFFPEPDLPPLVITNDRIEAVKTKLSDVELPDETLWRLQDQYGLPDTVARWFVCADHNALDYFERLVNGEEWRTDRRDPAVAAKFVCNNLFGLFKEDLDKRIGIAAEEISLEGVFPAERLGGLLDLLTVGSISNSTAKEVIKIMYKEDTESTAAEIVEDRGLNMMTDPAQIEAICQEVVDHPSNAFKLNELRKGNKSHMKFFMKKAFAATRNRADGHLIKNTVTRLTIGPAVDGERIKYKKRKKGPHGGRLG